MNDWFLLVDSLPGKGSLNMAVDEFLFDSLTDEPRTFLRFYQWERPAASLGYSQKAVNVLDLEFCKANRIDVVRRITGGKMVLHHQEITYAVASSDQSVFSPTLGGSYKIISQALMNGLLKMGLQPSLAQKASLFYAKGSLPCFSRPAQDEIEVDGKKIVGSAQKRVGKKFLQHGSIPLRHDETLLRSVSRLKASPEAIHMTSLDETVGSDVDFRWAVSHFVDGFGEFFKVRFAPLKFTKDHWAKIKALQKNKYENEDWTFPK